ncbi:hypothetical protein QQF64_003162 [Cirrhinus molitorella]|uniref:C-type lectin domain-containing protein n=1 Tax=Cirrhinus molitorella TaxID=172907 RepID=A0ABR3MK29_9TELE
MVERLKQAAFQFSVLFNDTRSLICRNTGADSNTWVNSNIWADGNTGADSNIWADGNTGADSNIWADCNTGADSNIWADGNTGADSNIWAAHTPQANFDYGIIYKATVRWASGCRFKAKLEFGQETCNQGNPISCTSDSSAMSSTVTTAMTRRTPSPARSPRMYIQTVSNLSLPPSPVSTTTSSKPSVAARAEVSAAASSSTPLAPVTSASSTVDLSAHLTAPGSEPYHLRIRSGFHLLCGRTSGCALT